jgi:hypothetical protein
MKIREFNRRCWASTRPASPLRRIGARGLPSAVYPLLAEAMNKPQSFFEPRSAVVQTNGGDRDVPVA